MLKDFIWNILNIEKRARILIMQAKHQQNSEADLNKIISNQMARIMGDDTSHQLGLGRTDWENSPPNN